MRAGKRQGVPPESVVTGKKARTSKTLKFQSGGANGWDNMGQYMAKKKAAVHQQREEEYRAHLASRAATTAQEQVKLNLFKGVGVYISGDTTPSYECIKEWVIKGAGTMHNWEDNLGVTHFVAERLPHTKIKRAHSRIQSRRMSYVKPEWIEACVRAGRLVPVNRYLPECLQDPEQRRIIDNFRQHQSPKNTTGIGTTKSSREQTTRRPKGVEEHESPADFLDCFFSHSRLHFLGTFKLHMRKAAMNLRREYWPAGISNRPVLTSSIIAHVDMDCFFCSVALRKRQDLRGKPFVVAWSGDSNSGNGEISSASYEARAMGVRAGMWLEKAREICPGLEVVPYEFEEYQMVSEQVYRLCYKLTPCVEVSSCDEAYIDITWEVEQRSRLSGQTRRDAAAQLVKELRAEILATTKCSASAGVAKSKTIAKMATDMSKKHTGKNSQCVLYIRDDAEYARRVRKFMSSCLLKDVPGIGWKTTRRLDNIAINTVQEFLDTYSSKRGVLENAIGAASVKRWVDLTSGNDFAGSSLKTEIIPGSVSLAVNWGLRFTSTDNINAFIKDMCRRLGERLEIAELSGRRLTLHVKKKVAAWRSPKKHLGHGKCHDIEESIGFHGSGVWKALDIEKGVARLWCPGRKCYMPPDCLRGFGLKMSDLIDLHKQDTQKTITSMWTPAEVQVTRLVGGSAAAASASLRKEKDILEKQPLPSAEVPEVSFSNPLFLSSSVKIPVSLTNFPKPTGAFPPIAAQAVGTNEGTRADVGAGSSDLAASVDDMYGFYRRTCFFPRQKWTRPLRDKFTSFMAKVAENGPVTSTHVEFLVRFLHDMIVEQRLDEVALALRCIRQTSCLDKRFEPWRKPFFIVLYAVTDLIRSEASLEGKGIFAVVDTKFLTPAISREEELEVIQWLNAGAFNMKL